MKSKTFATGCLACLVLATSASAVELNTGGTGQVLIYPYYTTHGGRTSQIQLTNNADAAKAVKLMVRGGATGTPVFVLNVYLHGHDTWTGTVFSQGGDSAAPALLSNDSSCTVPDLHGAALPTLPDGRHYLPPNAGESAAVPGEGYVVAIEMGELQGDSADALEPDGSDIYDHQAPPAHCDTLVDAWQAGGYWREAASTNVSAPGGGLSGSMMLIDVAKGAVFTTRATALEDFRVAAMHTAPESTLPDLGSALSDATTGVASATMRVGDTLVRSDYPAERAVDAVTAVLMVESLSAEFDFRRSTGAHTDFVLTMPTKRFYVGAGDEITLPFRNDWLHQRSRLGTLCQVIFINAHTRTGDGAAIYSHAAESLEWPEDSVPQPCYATSVYALNHDTRPRSLLDSTLTAAWRPFDGRDAPTGTIDYFMTYYDPRCLRTGNCLHSTDYVRSHINVMRADLEGRQYFGLPVIGFAATGFVNDHAGGLGILGNYTYATPYRRAAAFCMQDGVVGACE